MTARRNHARWMPLCCCLLLAAAVIGIYAQTARHGFSNLDDPDYVTNNLVVRGGLSRAGAAWAFTTFAAGNWHPLTWLSHQADVSLFGMNPRGHHLMSVAFHLACVLLLFLFLRAATGRAGGSFAAALLLAVHPLRVESVAWVAERKDLLSAGFFVLALLAWLAWLRRPSAWRYFVALLLQACSLMAKPMAVTLPLVMLLLDGWPFGRLDESRGGNAWGKGGALVRLVVEKLPFFCLSLASGLVTLRAQGSVGAIKEMAVFPLFARIANAFWSSTVYLDKLFRPASLAVFYPHSGAAFPLWKGLIGFGLVAGVTVGAFLLRRRAPALLAGWAWYLVMLLPVIGLVQVGTQAMADRYTYLPSIGILLALIFGPDWRRGTKSARRAARIILIGAALLLSLLAWRQAGYWRSDIALYEHALAVTGPNAFVEVNLGEALAGAHRDAEALVYYDRVLAAEPENIHALYSRGVALSRLKRRAEAVDAYRRTLAVDSGHVQARFNLALVLLALGERELALEEYAALAAIDPAAAAGLARFLGVAP